MCQGYSIPLIFLQVNGIESHLDFFQLTANLESIVCPYIFKIYYNVQSWIGRLMIRVNSSSNSTFGDHVNVVLLATVQTMLTFVKDAEDTVPDFFYYYSVEALEVASWCLESVWIESG